MNSNITSTNMCEGEGGGGVGIFGNWKLLLPKYLNIYYKNLLLFKMLIDFLDKTVQLFTAALHAMIGIQYSGQFKEIYQYE